MLANEICEYWRRVHRCAFDETKHMLRIETGLRAMIAAAVTVCAIAMIWFVGEPNIAHHEIVVRLSLIAVILLVSPFVYGWQFLTAPAKLDVEAQKEIASLKKDRTYKKSVAEVTAISNALETAHAEALPDQGKCLRERQQLLRSLIEQYLREKQCQ